MTGCEYVKCSDWDGKQCNFNKPFCKYRPQDNPVNQELLDCCKWLLFHAENGRRNETVAHAWLNFTKDEFENRLRTVIEKAERD